MNSKNDSNNSISSSKSPEKAKKTLNIIELFNKRTMEIAEKEKEKTQKSKFNSTEIKKIKLQSSSSNDLKDFSYYNLKIEENKSKKHVSFVNFNYSRSDLAKETFVETSSNIHTKEGDEIEEMNKPKEYSEDELKQFIFNNENLFKREKEKSRFDNAYIEGRNCANGKLY